MWPGPPCRHGTTAGGAGRARDVQDAEAARAELGLVELLADARYPTNPT